MTDKEIARFSAPVIQAYRDMEDELLRLIAKQIMKDKRVSDTSAWRIRQLARAGEINQQALAIIDSYAGGISSEIAEAILAAAEGEVGTLDAAMLNLLSEKGKMTDEQRNMLDAFQRQSRQELNIENARIAESYAQALQEDCNLVNTVMGYQTASAYSECVRETADELDRQAVINELNAGSMSVVSGTESLQEATRRTLERLAVKGIPGFIDKAGREWSPEAYVKMDLRSTMGNTARAAQDARCDRYGIQLIEVSSHNGARPKCAPYQGRIFSRNGTAGTTTDLNDNPIRYIPLSQTSYGEPDGLFGINCGHQQYPFIPGVSMRTYYPYPEEQNAERYQQTQQQRAMERKIRADKRKCMMMQETGDDEGLKKAAGKLRADKDRYRDFCKETGLGAHMENTQVYGYDRSKSMKTVWAGRTKGSGNGGSAANSTNAGVMNMVTPNTVQQNIGGIKRNPVLTGGGNGGIINRAKDIFQNVGTATGYVSPERLIEELNKSEIGRQALEYLSNSNVRAFLDYTPQFHNYRGQQQGDIIQIFMSNIGNNPLLAAQTVAHEVCHHKYDIGKCQWAEAVCMCHEKMVKENRTTLTFAEIRKIVKLARDNYPELNWKKGGYRNGRKF